MDQCKEMQPAVYLQYTSRNERLNGTEAFYLVQQLCTWERNAEPQQVACEITCLGGHRRESMVDFFLCVCVVKTLGIISWDLCSTRNIVLKFCFRSMFCTSNLLFFWEIISFLASF